MENTTLQGAPLDNLRDEEEFQVTQAWLFLLRSICSSGQRCGQPLNPVEAPCDGNTELWTAPCEGHAYRSTYEDHGHEHDPCQVKHKY